MITINFLITKLANVIINRRYYVIFGADVFHLGKRNNSLIDDDFSILSNTFTLLLFQLFREVQIEVTKIAY